MHFAVIAAGGIGSRMGSEIPKQYIKVGSKPIIAHTVQKFLDFNEFTEVIVLCPADWCEYTQSLLDDNCTGKATVICGGKDRNDTIMNSVKYIEEKHGIDNSTVIVTHDAVRPFVPTEVIGEHIKKSSLYDAIGTVIPATDTIIQSDNGLTVTATPDRSKLYQCQTPQTFKAAKLRELYKSLSPEKKSILTDSCSIFTVSGEDVYLTSGDVQNIKITYPYDLKVAEVILR